MRGLPLLVVVHPTEFGRQQQHTMEGLLGAVRQDERFPQLLGKLSRQSRIELISRSYLHVWVNCNGEIISLTHPAWNTEKQGFQHDEVELDRKSTRLNSSHSQ